MINRIPTTRTAIPVVKVKFLLLFFSFSQRYIKKNATIGTDNPKIIYLSIKLF